MKILFFIGALSEGGAERVISILANNLVRDFDVEILKYYNSDNFYNIEKKVKITSVEENTNSKNKILNIKWVREYFKNNADLIISFLAVFNMYALVANICNDIPVIVADRNDPRYIPKNKILRFIRNRLYRKANAVVLQTKSNKEYFDSLIQKKSYVIYNPINMNSFVGKALNTSKEKIIVSVGRLEVQKNQIMLIEAFNEIRKKYDDYKLIIYGEGPYRKQLEDKINELNLSSYVLLPGNKKNIFDEISKAELFVLSSNYEGMPNALIEAMCLGLPCISTRVSGATDLIQDGVNGLLVDVGDTNDLTSKITRLIDDKEYAYKLANKAIEIIDILDVNVICDKWLEMINNVVK